jgi:deoxyribodipyrimidine photo-lyase
LVPSHVLSLLESFGATQIFANIEYELDELRRDIKLCALAKEKGIKVELFHDRCIVEPGVVKTGQGKTYTVSPAHKPKYTL